MTDWPKLTPDQTSALQSLCHLVLLRGIELGLDAAAKAADAYDNLAAKAIQRLNPETIAKETQHD